MYEISEEDYLAHFGVLGMKWGHRKDKKSGQTKNRKTGKTKTDNTGMTIFDKNGNAVYSSYIFDTNDLEGMKRYIQSNKAYISKRVFQILKGKETGNYNLSEYQKRQKNFLEIQCKQKIDDKSYLVAMGMQARKNRDYIYSKYKQIKKNGNAGEKYLEPVTVFLE